MSGFSAATIVNTTTAGSEITVGAKAAVAFSALPANDFVDAAGAYLSTSQGCRAA